MKKRFVFAIGITALFFLLISLPQAQADDVVKIGVIGPMTGGTAIVGLDSLRGGQLIVKEVNDQGGLNIDGKKYKVEIVSMDDAGSPANSVAGVRRLVNLHKVPVIIGPFISSCVLAVLEISDKKPTEVMNVTYALHPDITKRGNKLIVRIGTSAKTMGYQLASTWIKLKKPKSVAIIYHTDDWGYAWKEGLLDAARKNGIKITAEEGIDERKQTDFYIQLTKIVETKPDAIMMMAHEAATVMMIKQVREIGYKGRLIFSEAFGPTGRALVPADMFEGGMKVTSNVDLNTPNYQLYVAKFNRAYPNEQPAPYGAYVYDSLKYIFKAMEKAKNVTDPYAIRAALPQVMATPAPNAILNILPVDKDGHAILDYPIGELKNGKMFIAE